MLLQGAVLRATQHVLLHLPYYVVHMFVVATLAKQGDLMGACLCCRLYNGWPMPIPNSGCSKTRPITQIPCRHTRRAWLSSLACLRSCFGSRQLSTMSKSRSSTATDAMLHKETNSHSVYAAVQLHTEGSISYACVTVQEQTCFALCSNCNKCISSTSVCMSSIACSHTP